MTPISWKHRVKESIFLSWNSSKSLEISLKQLLSRMCRNMRQPISKLLAVDLWVAESCVRAWDWVWVINWLLPSFLRSQETQIESICSISMLKFIQALLGVAKKEWIRRLEALKSIQSWPQSWKHIYFTRCKRFFFHDNNLIAWIFSLC